MSLHHLCCDIVDESFLRELRRVSKEAPAPPAASPTPPAGEPAAPLSGVSQGAGHPIPVDMT